MSTSKNRYYNYQRKIRKEAQNKYYERRRLGFPQTAYNNSLRNLMYSQIPEWPGSTPLTRGELAPLMTQEPREKLVLMAPNYPRFNAPFSGMSRLPLALRPVESVGESSGAGPSVQRQVQRNLAWGAHGKRTARGRRLAPAESVGESNWPQIGRAHV